MKSSLLFSNKQFGFLPCRSTVLQLMNVLEKWIQILDENEPVDIIYHNFMKSLKWTGAFVEFRKKCEVVINQKSEWPEVEWCISEVCDGFIIVCFY